MIVKLSEVVDKLPNLIDSSMDTLIAKARECDDLQDFEGWTRGSLVAYILDYEEWDEVKPGDE